MIPCESFLIHLKSQFKAKNLKKIKFENEISIFFGWIGPWYRASQRTLSYILYYLKYIFLSKFGYLEHVLM